MIIAIKGFGMLIHIISLICSFFIITLFPSCKEMEKSKKPGTIIFLHGISSAGKTSVAKKLQDVLPEYYNYADLDAFTSMTPKRLVNFDPNAQPSVEAAEQGIVIEPITYDGQQVMVVKTGSYSQKGGMLLPKLYKLYVENGFNLIIEFAFSGIDQQLQENYLKEYLKELHSFRVYFINLTVSPEVASQRELQRGGFKGLSAGQRLFMLKEFTEPQTFDLEIDTSNLTPEQIAQQIDAFMQSHPQPEAFNKLYKKYF